MRKILVIEDEKLVRSNILELLSEEGYQTIGAENGLVGVGLARKEMPDLIISDIMMPELDGYGVLSFLQQDPQTATIPLIFLTAKTERLEQREGMRLGADDYLTKPFTRRELLDAISTRIGKHDVTEKLIGDKLESLYNKIFHALPKEFNAPLSDIMTMTNTLSQTPLEHEKVAEIATNIKTAAGDVSGLIQRFLLSTELEISRLKPQETNNTQSVQSCSVKEIITETAQQIAQDTKRVKDLSVSIQEAVVKISQVSLKILVEELIKHTFRYSTLQTPVRISSLTKNSTYIIYVSATSQEVEFEYLSTPNAYSHLQSNFDQLMAGGLGLTIARQIAEMHGGELTTEIMHGRRTMVKVVLPM